MYGLIIGKAIKGHITAITRQRGMTALSVLCSAMCMTIVTGCSAGKDIIPVELGMPVAVFNEQQSAKDLNINLSKYRSDFWGTDKALSISARFGEFTLRFDGVSELGNYITASDFDYVNNINTDPIIDSFSLALEFPKPFEVSKNSANRICKRILNQIDVDIKEPENFVKYLNGEKKVFDEYEVCILKSKSFQISVNLQRAGLEGSGIYYPRMTAQFK